MLDKTRNIIITGGHFTPALAVKDELVKNGYKNIIWVGTKHSQTHNKNLSPEYLSVTKAGIKFVELKTGKLWRKVTVKTILPALYNLILIPLGFLKAFAIVLRYKPVLVISFGGHIALPVVFAAKLLRKNTATHEQTLVTGSTNKFIARLADIILVSWKSSLNYFPREKTVLVGLPIRKEILATSASVPIFPNTLPVLLVMGGNQGANTINWRLLEILPNLLNKINVIHLTGNSTLTQDFEKALSLKKSLPENQQSRYIVKTDAFGSENYFQSSNLLLSRSGANTVAEILALGKLSILIPIPWSSHNEQQLNAELVEKTGLGMIIPQTAKLAPQDIQTAIDTALDCLRMGKAFNDKELSEVRREAAKLVDFHAGEKFYSAIEPLLNSDF